MAGTIVKNSSDDAKCNSLPPLKSVNKECVMRSKVECVLAKLGVGTEADLRLKLKNTRGQIDGIRLVKHC